MTPEELHITSLVVHATPRRAAAVGEAVAALPGAVVHGAAGGKLVVTLEAATSAQMAEQVSALHHLPGVLSVALVYQCADSLDAMNEEISDA